MGDPRFLRLPPDVEDDVAVRLGQLPAAAIARFRATACDDVLAISSASRIGFEVLRLRLRARRLQPRSQLLS